jgi:DNA-binding transcriptional regulator YiaG
LKKYFFKIIPKIFGKYVTVTYICAMKAKQLKSLRKAANLKQVQLAELLDVEQGHLSKWENDVFAISKPYAKLIIIKIEEILGKERVEEVMEENKE